jgi:hypothetical protein
MTPKQHGPGDDEEDQKRERWTRRALTAILCVCVGVIAGASVSSAPAVLTGNIRVYNGNGISCTDATGATPIPIADATGTFSAKFISVVNDGADEVFVDFNGATATTADTPIAAAGSAGSSFTVALTDNSTNAYACVASAGETASLRVVAMR